MSMENAIDNKLQPKQLTQVVKITKIFIDSNDRATNKREFNEKQVNKLQKIIKF